MAEVNEKATGLATPGERAGPLATVDVRPRDIGAWIVSDQELESLRTSAHVNSASVGLFGLAFGAALSLIITLQTATFASPYTYAAFWAAFLVMVLGTLLFGALAIIFFFRARGMVRQIKSESATRQLELTSLAAQQYPQ